MRQLPFADFDFSDFWDTHEYYVKEYIEPPPTPQIIAQVEAELGYKLPVSYIALMQTQNGGAPINTCFPCDEPTSWAEDHVAITAFKAIGFNKQWSLCGSLGSQFKIDEWEYPDIGIYFGDCPSAGHDMIALDYRQCGAQGEPQVVHVDQEDDYKITYLAENFEAFVRGLVNEEAFGEDPEIIKQETLQEVKNAPFSKLLQTLCDAYPDNNMPQKIRTLAAEIVEDKGFFALHADAQSYLMYDLQWLLYTHSRTVKSLEGYLQAYPSMIAMTLGGEFGTGGWAQAFVEDWWHTREHAGVLVKTEQGYGFIQEYGEQINHALAKMAV